MEKPNKNYIVTALAVICALAVAGFIVAIVSGRTGALANLAPTGRSEIASVYGDFVVANNFAVLAGSTITNTGNSVITGDLGLSPGTAITGFFGTVEADGPGTVSGSVHQADPAAATAEAALSGAYTNVAGEPCPTGHNLSGQDLGGMTLTPGVYCFSSSAGLTGTLSLNAGGDANAVFIFQIGSTLTTASGSSVVFTNGVGSSCNVFWQVGTSATLGSAGHFKGNIFASASISTADGSAVDGRLLASSGAVTLINTSVNAPVCTTPVAPVIVTPATLHIIKSVVSVTGTATAPDFLIHVKSSTSTLDVAGSPFAGTSSPGTLYTLPPGVYIVSEDSNPSFPTYAPSFGLDCVGGTFTLASGQDKICTVINTDDPVPPATVPAVVPATVPTTVPTTVPSATVVPVISNGGSSSSGGGGWSLPLLSIQKVPNPLALPAGPGQVAYNYTVQNIGGTPAVDVTLTDDKCAPVTRLSGDVNNNNKLDIGESWKYGCTATLSTTTTNTAVVTGYSDDSYHHAAVATALATVVVGASVTPPLINIVKVPSRLTPFPFGGGDVTYAYTVTNPGVVALHDVAVTDDKCTPVSRVSGDINANNLLDVGESWIYTCRTNVSASTRNIATAKGTANGFIALGYAFANVYVSAPSLPNTGFPPK
jgi:hypothetical protein